MIKIIPTILLAIAAAAVTPMANARSGAEIVNAQCISCHAVTKPAASSVDRILARKGPDLHYAGSKFNRDWLVAWLQSPMVIRPGGAVFLQALQPGAAGSPDAIETAKLAPHPKLAAPEAAAAADYLMGLTGDGLVEKGAFRNEPPNASMASLLFGKLRGCASCHSAKAGAGGSSGAELQTAGDRLQADYIASYLRDPQKFDPHVPMPRLDLNEGDVQKLTGYLLTLKKGASQ